MVNPDASTGMSQQGNPRPLCGTLSIVLPFIGFGVYLAIGLLLTGDKESTPLLFTALIILFLSMVAGGFLALIALRRKERLPFLALLGLLVNGGPWIYGFVHRHIQ